MNIGYVVLRRSFGARRVDKEWRQSIATKVSIEEEVGQILVEVKVWGLLEGEVTRR